MALLPRRPKWPFFMDTSLNTLAKKNYLFYSFKPVSFTEIFKFNVSFLPSLKVIQVLKVIRIKAKLSH
jgi:hypothetical protein